MKSKTAIGILGILLIGLSLASGCVDTSQEGVYQEEITQEENTPILNLDINKIELNVLDLVNMERSYNLLLNEELSDIAKQHSKDMATKGFSHTLDGKDVGDRLKEKNIYYFAVGENLVYIPITTEDELEISRLTVEDWLKSPGHRSNVLDVDEMYTDAGLGVYCDEQDCYITMIFAGLETYFEDILDAKYCAFYPLYDETDPFNFDVSVKLDFDSNKKVSAHLVPDIGEFENCYNRKNIKNYIKKYSYITQIDDTVTVERGNGLLIQTYNDGTEISLLVDYR